MSRQPRTFQNADRSDSRRMPFEKVEIGQEFQALGKSHRKIELIKGKNAERVDDPSKKLFFSDTLLVTVKTPPSPDRDIETQ